MSTLAQHKAWHPKHDPQADRTDLPSDLSCDFCCGRKEWPSEMLTDEEQAEQEQEQETNHTLAILATVDIAQLATKLGNYLENVTDSSDKLRQGLLNDLEGVFDTLDNLLDRWGIRQAVEATEGEVN